MAKNHRWTLERSTYVQETRAQLNALAASLVGFGAGECLAIDTCFVVPRVARAVLAALPVLQCIALASSSSAARASSCSTFDRLGLQQQRQRHSALARDDRGRRNASARLPSSCACATPSALAAGFMQ